MARLEAHRAGAGEWFSSFVIPEVRLLTELPFEEKKKNSPCLAIGANQQDGLKLPEILRQKNKIK